MSSSARRMSWTHAGVLPARSLTHLASGGKQPAIGIDQVGDLDILHPAESADVGLSPSVDPGYGDADAVVGSQHSAGGVRAGRWRTWWRLRPWQQRVSGNRDDFAVTYAASWGMMASQAGSLRHLFLERCSPLVRVLGQRRRILQFVAKHPFQLFQLGTHYLRTIGQLPMQVVVVLVVVLRRKNSRNGTISVTIGPRNALAASNSPRYFCASVRCSSLW